MSDYPETVKLAAAAMKAASTRYTNYLVETANGDEVQAVLREQGRIRLAQELIIAELGLKNALIKAGLMENPAR